MRWQNYSVTAPLILGGQISEAEVLGASVWLWMHSDQHRDAPLHTLPDILLPVIKSQQYVLASRANQPVFFLSWMWLSEEAERRYLTEPAIFTRQNDWTSGERLWLRDWIAPFGDTAAMSRLVLDQLFPQHCLRAQYHRGKVRGRRVINFHGSQLSRADALLWRDQHPLSVPLKEQ